MFSAGCVVIWCDDDNEEKLLHKQNETSSGSRYLEKDFEVVVKTSV